MLKKLKKNVFRFRETFFISLPPSIVTHKKRIVNPSQSVTSMFYVGSMYKELVYSIYLYA